MSDPKDGDTSSSASVPREPTTEKGDIHSIIGTDVSTDMVTSHQEEEYPTGIKLALLVIALMLSMFLVGFSQSLLLKLSSQHLTKLEIGVA
jgi:type III secretory pathway component EscS